MLKTFGISVLLLGVAGSAGQEPIKSGIDLQALDPTCKPCQDFWRYANGGWLDKNPIPPRFSSWGPPSLLAETTRQQLRELLETAANDTTAKPGTNRRKVGDLYSACTDTAAIDGLGAKPLQPYFDRVSGISSVKDLSAALVWVQQDIPVGPFRLGANADLKDSKTVVLHVVSGGLSLPERDYYFKDDARSKEIREAFQKHVAQMLELLGDTPEIAETAAHTILAFETRLAEATKTAVERRDVNSMYHKVDLAGLSHLTPDFDWKPLFAALRIPEAAGVNVSEPDFLSRFNQQLTAAPLDEWKTWLRWRGLNATADRLSKPFVDETFHFRSTVLQGVTEQQPRWRTCTSIVDAAMGEALGSMYVEKHFPPQAKQRAKELVGNLRATLGDQIQHADWLTPETRKSALAKLEAFAEKIGYPDTWRDYSGLRIDRKSYFDDLRAATVFQRRFEFAKIGKPVDRSEWGMTPPTINAYYNPLQNEIVFPAGILQPPFFDPQSDDAVNYGGIGAVIGHEMGHGFDDQGAQFDADGNLRNWWTPDDRETFTERASCVVEQFDTLDIGGGLHHKGKLVVGEAMGDLNGVKLAYKAYQRSLGGKPGPVIDGLTADQRFFIAYARFFGSQYRPEAIQLRINTDPHPISKFRVNATLQNVPEFHKAFECQGGDPMVRPAEKQCGLW
jgi:putative endopeptidase